MSSPFTFVFLADMQLGCYASFSGFDDAQIEAYATMGMLVTATDRVEGFEWDANRYRRAVAIINKLQPAMVIVGGDMVNDANSEDQINEYLAITSEIDGDIAVRWVPGNHDIAADATVPTRASIDAYRAVFGPDYYSFRHHETLFIALNTTVIDHPEEVPEEWDAQYSFLLDELDQAGRSGVERTVLLGHHPLFLEQADEPDSYWNLPMERRRAILDAVHGAGVEIGFAGHWHRNAVARDEDFVQVTSGPVGYPLGTDPSGYRVVYVHREGVDHAYRDLEGG